MESRKDKILQIKQKPKRLSEKVLQIRMSGETRVLQTFIQSKINMAN